MKKLNWFSVLAGAIAGMLMFGLGERIFVHGLFEKESDSYTTEELLKTDEPWAYDILGRAALSDKSYEEAFGYLKKASDGGELESTGLLGCLYYEGHGVEQDYEKAFECLNKVYNSDGYVGNKVRYYLGLCYWEGRGVQQDKKKGIGLIIDAAGEYESVKEWVSKMILEENNE